MDRANNLLENMLELHLTMLQNARQQALDELTRIDEALAQVQDAVGD
jgi:hypothetical protein